MALQAICCSFVDYEAQLKPVEYLLWTRCVYVYVCMYVCMYVDLKYMCIMDTYI
jgi:hypothetical protein